MEVLINNIKKYKSLITFVLGALIVLLFLKQCNQISNLKQDVKQAEASANREYNNYLAATDTIRIVKAKNGNLISEKRGYEFDIVNLKEDQKSLIDKYRDALNLNKDLNTVNSLISAEISIKDSLLANVSATQIDSLTTKLTFNKFNDFGNGNSRDLSGSMFITKNLNGFTYDNATFDIKQNISLMAAIEDIDGYNQLKISSGYPGLTISSIENINLINTKLNQRYEKKAGWSIGLGVGYGVNLNNNQVISTGPSIGVGLFYSPKWLRF